MSKKILFNHYIATKGLIINHDTISAATTEGVKLVNSMICKYLNTTEDNFQKLGFDVLTINRPKMKIFFEIINDNLC